MKRILKSILILGLGLTTQVFAESGGVSSYAIENPNPSINYQNYQKGYLPSPSNSSYMGSVSPSDAVDYVTPLAVYSGYEKPLRSSPSYVGYADDYVIPLAVYSGYEKPLRSSPSYVGYADDYENPLAAPMGYEGGLPLSPSYKS